MDEKVPKGIIGQYSTDQFPIKINYYYIIDFSKFFYPRLLPVYFVNKEAAKRALKVNIKNLQKRKKHSVLSGREIKDENLKYRMKEGKLGEFTKYQYPDSRKSLQQRKTYRTVMRRRLRRMGLLTLIKPKRSIKDPIQVVKHIRNTQKVARSPNTKARAFTLERKPYLIFIILRKSTTNKSGKLFKIESIRIDTRKWTHKQLWVYTMRNDIIKPLLLTEVINMIPNDRETLIRLVREIDFKPNKKRAKNKKEVF